MACGPHSFNPQLKKKKKFLEKCTDVQTKTREGGKEGKEREKRGRRSSSTAPLNRGYSTLPRRFFTTMAPNRRRQSIQLVRRTSRTKVAHSLSQFVEISGYFLKIRVPICRD